MQISEEAADMDECIEKDIPIEDYGGGGGYVTNQAKARAPRAPPLGGSRHAAMNATQSLSAAGQWGAAAAALCPAAQRRSRW